MNRAHGGQVLGRCINRRCLPSYCNTNVIVPLRHFVTEYEKFVCDWQQLEQLPCDSTTFEVAKTSRLEYPMAHSQGHQTWLSPAQKQLIELTADVLIDVFSYLDYQDLLTLRAVSSHFFARGHGVSADTENLEVMHDPFQIDLRAYSMDQSASPGVYSAWHFLAHFSAGKHERRAVGGRGVLFI
jgi:hypothetical protein